MERLVNAIVAPKMMYFEIIIQSLDKITIVIAILLFFLYDYRSSKWKKKLTQSKTQIPGPRPIPILGTQWLFYFGSWHLNKLHEYYEHMHQKYGPIVKEEAMLNIPVYSIFERRDIEKVLKAPSKFPIRPPQEALAAYRYSRPDRYSSAGLVNEQGENWHFLRNSITPILTSPKTLLNFEREAEMLAEDWCLYIKSKRGAKVPMIDDLNTFVVQLCIETTCALVLGKRMGFLCPDNVPYESVRLAEALQNNFKGLRDTQFGLPLWKYFPTKSYKLMVESEDFIYETISEMIKDFSEEATIEDTVYRSIIDAEIDEREKTAAIIDFISAAKHPEVQKKIIGDINYSKACMMEAFRLLPTATPLARILEQDVELSGFTLKAGNVVLCHNSIACRNEKNFLKPDDFWPERWLEGDQKNKLNNNAMFLVVPFGAGRRMCPGKRFIELVLPIFLRNTVRNFEIGTEDVLELQFEFLRAAKGPISMMFRDRN